MSEELRRGIPKGRVIGQGKPYTKEEQEKHDRDFEKILRQYGVIGDNEFIRDGKLVKEV